MASPQRTPGKSPHRKKKKGKQPIKLLTGLKKLSVLNLSREKIELFSKNSVLKSLVLIENDKESSATLVEALASFYDDVSKKFHFNGKSFSFCPDEVAAVLDIPRGKLDYDTLKSELSKSRVNQFPETVYDLQKMVNKNVKPNASLSDQDLRLIIEKMEVEKDEEKQLFLQLLSYYHIEQFALCGTKLGNPRHTWWKYVSNMEKFNEVDWPSAIHNHLMVAISEAHQFAIGGMKGQNSFRGCAPVLEAIVFQRLPTLYSRRETKKSCDFPPIQSYSAQRNSTKEWKSKILGSEIKACMHCPSPASPTTPPHTPIPLSSPPTHAPLSPPPPSTPPHTPIPTLSTHLEEAHEALGVGLSSLKLTANEDEEIRAEGSSGRAQGRTEGYRRGGRETQERMKGGRRGGREAQGRGGRRGGREAQGRDLYHPSLGLLYLPFCHLSFSLGFLYLPFCNLPFSLGLFHCFPPLLFPHLLEEPKGGVVEEPKGGRESRSL